LSQLFVLKFSEHQDQLHMDMRRNFTCKT